jgi:hypothetical protein
MDGVTSESQSRPRRKNRLARTLVAVAVVIALLFGSSLLAGNLRADSIARDYFIAHHGSSTVANVTIDAESQWIPPFWSVRISGDVIEPGGSSVTYRSQMQLLVEPISGLVVFNGAG